MLFSSSADEWLEQRTKSEGGHESFSLQVSLPCHSLVSAVFLFLRWQRYKSVSCSSFPFYSLRLALLYIISLTLISAPFLTREPYMVFHVNSDGKYFITHPWKLLEIASWDIAKFVVAPFCLVGLVFQMWTFANQTQGLQQDQGNLKPDEKMVKNPPKKKKNKKSSSKKKEGNLQYQHVGETEIEADQENDIDIRYGDQSIYEPQPQSHQPTENLELELKSIVRDKSSINNLTKLLAVGADGIEVFEDTRDQRLVAVKRIIYSDEALAIAYNERQNHYNTENHSNQILRHYGLDFTDSYIYVYLQPWMCTIGDLIRFCSSKGSDTRYLTQNQICLLEKFIKKNKCWEATGRPSSLLVSLIKNIVSGVAELHRSNIIHRDINLESFFIMATEDEDFIAKLGDLSMGKLLGDSGYFGEQKRKAPEQIQRKNQFEGLTNDVYFLGCVFGFSISQGNHVFEDVCEDDIIFKQNAKIILKNFPEGYQIFKNLTRTPHAKR